MNENKWLDPADIARIQTLITLADELHFGRTAIRLGFSQSRVSQLVAELERRVGVRLVERSSRAVSLTQAGVRFLDDASPAFTHMVTALTRARERALRAEAQDLRVGFSGSAYQDLGTAVRDLGRSSTVDVTLTEAPWGSPFSDLIEGLVDVAVVELPVREPGLVVGFVFEPQDRLLAVGTSHPLAASHRVSVEDLEFVDLVGPAGSAPRYWRETQVPPMTPAGRPIRSSASRYTIEEGLALVAGGRHGMLICRPFSERLVRPDVAFLAVDGLVQQSQLGIVWRDGDAQASALLLVEQLRAHDG